LRGLRDPKILGWSLPDDPQNAVVPIDDERHGIPTQPGNFAIDEQILQFLLPAAHARRPEPVAPLPGSDRER
jgi:hypothetical protein